MKLLHIYGVGTSGAWGRLAKLQVSPSLAYSLLKYNKEVMAEFTLVEEMRSKLVYDIAGAKPEEKNVSLKKGSPEIELFIQKFNKLLETEAKLATFGMELSTIISELEAKEEDGISKRNSISVEDLAVLEPFFELKK